MQVLHFYARLLHFYAGYYISSFYYISMPYSGSYTKKSLPRFCADSKYQTVGRVVLALDGPFTSWVRAS